MKLTEFKKYIIIPEQVIFELWNGKLVPSHYHITEIGIALKKFIDCGGEIRYEEKVSFQLRTADDVEHRLHSEKILRIISLFEKNISSKDLDVEIEYQGETIGKYGLEWIDNKFILMPTKTDCLAKDKCGIPERDEQNTCCGGGCC